jgi:hypothetical protein
VARALAQESMFLTARGDGERGQELARAALSLGVRDDLVGAYTTWTRGAKLHFLDNRWRSALDEFSDAARQLRSSQMLYPWEVMTLQHFVAISRLYLGEVEGLREELDRSTADAERRGNRYGSYTNRPRFAALWLMSGEIERVEEDLVEAMKVVKRAGDVAAMPRFWGVYGMALLALYRNEPRAMLGAVEALVIDRARSLLWAPLTRVELGEIRCRLLAMAGAQQPAAGDRRGYVTEIKRSLRQFLRPNMPPVAAVHHRLFCALSAHIRGDDDAAVDGLRDTVREYEALEAGLHTDAAKHQLGQLLGGDEGRSQRDHAIASLRARGVVDPERFAEALVPLGRLS